MALAPSRTCLRSMPSLIGNFPTLPTTRHGIVLTLQVPRQYLDVRVKIAESAQCELSARVQESSIAATFLDPNSIRMTMIARASQVGVVESQARV